MENLIIFLIFLWATFFITRICAVYFHDKIYDKETPRKSKAKTLTGFLRRKTGFDWHHVHLGMIIIIISFFLFKIKFIVFLIFLAVGMSLFLDQIFPLINIGNYFSKKMFFISFLLHLIVSLFITLKF